METKNEFAQRYEQEKLKAAAERAYWMSNKVKELATDFAQKFGWNEEADSYAISDAIVEAACDWAEAKAIDFEEHKGNGVRPEWLEPDGTIRL